MVLMFAVVETKAERLRKEERLSACELKKAERLGLVWLRSPSALRSQAQEGHGPALVSFG